ncbi:MAG TPA: phosphatidylglycerophosphatase A [Pyrinomonadaceae bacterium]|nr:phosphatidylglycerophosphatase A [Pyrinomonadaceae bacterium]
MNPPIVEARGALPSRRARSAKDYLALAIATCGVGYLPLAPGTWGSLVGVALYFLLNDTYFKFKQIAFDKHWITADAFNFDSIFRDSFLFITLLLVVIGLISAVGTWAASRAEKLAGRKDASIVVVDEVAGQLLTFIFLPQYHIGLVTVLIGFIAFRFFDIVKPYPARKLESLTGGLGIMADDLVAGAYAALLLSVISFFSISGGITTAW